MESRREKGNVADRRGCLGTLSATLGYVIAPSASPVAWVRCDVPRPGKARLPDSTASP
jgi:hypothetical protein